MVSKIVNEVLSLLDTATCLTCYLTSILFSDKRSDEIEITQDKA